MSAESPLSSSLQKTGAGLCGLGALVFLSLMFLGHFSITDSDQHLRAAIENAGIGDGPQQEALVATVSQSLPGKSFAHSWAFQGALGKVLAAVSERLPKEQQIPAWRTAQLRYHLGKFAYQGPVVENTATYFWAVILAFVLGAFLYFLPMLIADKPGIRHNDIVRGSMSGRGLLAWAFGIFLISLYVGLYFYPQHIIPWITVFDPLAYAIKDGPADQWFFYGTIYTLAVLIMGVRMLIRYRHNRYHLLRTASVMFFQLGFAYLIPEVLAWLKAPAVDLKNAWPLDYAFYYDYRISGLKSHGTLGWVVFVWGISLSFIVVPLLAALVGKRWYCSWVCGCGGLAETLGDPFRQLSDKSLRAWRVERIVIHSVLVFVSVMTLLVVLKASGVGGFLGSLANSYSWKFQDHYGFWVGALFSGVFGTGLYPWLGNRVWCRFGCPMAAWLGLVQRFKSRFRITTNGNQCISCGNCSAFCEMGIDVRWYAQRGEDVVRASCVGCGVCAAVCPRGVLRLENGPVASRQTPSGLIQLGRVQK